MNTEDRTKSKSAKKAIIQHVQSHAKNQQLYKVYNINVPVDYLLKKAKNYIRKNGKSIIVIPDLEILGGCLKISNGILRDLSSLKRIGNATIFNTEQTRSIQASFGLSTLQLKCHYELTIGFITFSGNIFAAINGLGIAAKLNVDYDDYNKTYDASLEHFQIKRGLITIKMTGLIHDLMNIITSQITSSINTELYDIIEVIIRNFIKEQIKFHL
ncbi:PREDICTED: uncharacterized protein LOC108748907 [Trachymyrmex septentrionalis]|uniref:uncharacterized protein LOC108748907 n=1 Tax=Trachymyrmex septentrionalis TaxID=34720 RepID=UPI00084EE4FB|nr:PREDICTED: uncharacterized protein LOC108748907 [Trachymyrmex septentrionalis]XP_018342825.1 PREDICTED: uncharacterized protein LOC108748907 [Trachymyrmex septentrionalis]XP_018342826.1 PREDICTED: uncharacterized protein LOC108748907 [Trachymyrmex septentrionalis]